MRYFSPSPRNRRWPIPATIVLMFAAVMFALPELARPAHAEGAPRVEPAQLAGNTLSAVAYVPRPAGTGGGTLQRIMLQAYLAAGGDAVVRQWVPDRNSYSTPLQTHWSLAQDRLCIELRPAEPICAVVHIWTPRIAGIGTSPYAMLDGDLTPGNLITGRATR